MKRKSLTRLVRWVGAASLAVMISVGFASCSDDKSEPDKLFPDLSDIPSVAAGESTDITIKSSSTWTMSSDKTWCTVTPNTGGAGELSVKIGVSDAAHDFKDETAVVTFTNAEKSTSFKVTRPANVRKLQLFADNNGSVGDEINIIELKYDAGMMSYVSQVYVSSNYKCMIDMASVPEWIKGEPISEIAIEANAEPVAITFTGIPSEFQILTTPIKIKFKDFTDATKAVEVDAKPGITEDFILLASEDFTCTFTSAGVRKIGDVESGQKYQMFDIIAAKPGFAVVCVGLDEMKGKYGAGFYPDYSPLAFPNWLSTEKLPANRAGYTPTACELSVTENTFPTSRVAAVFCVPESMATSITDDPLQMFSEDQTEILDQFYEYYLGKITQEVGASKFKIEGDDALSDLGDGNYELVASGNKVYLQATLPADKMSAEPTWDDKATWLDVKVERSADQITLLLEITITDGSEAASGTSINFVYKDWDGDGSETTVGSLWISKAASKAAKYTPKYKLK